MSSVKVWAISDASKSPGLCHPHGIGMGKDPCIPIPGRWRYSVVFLRLTALSNPWLVTLSHLNFFHINSIQLRAFICPHICNFFAKYFLADECSNCLCLLYSATPHDLSAKLKIFFSLPEACGIADRCYIQCSSWMCPTKEKIFHLNSLKHAAYPATSTRLS